MYAGCLTGYQAYRIPYCNYYMSETLRAAAFLDKGGTGKTTTVAHLAVALEELGERGPY